MPNQCTINHIDHIGIAVKNIEQSVAFFTSIFGVPKPTISEILDQQVKACLLYTSPSPRDRTRSRMPSSA